MGNRKRADRPTADEMLEAIRASGYLFENEVAMEFEKAGYFVMPNYNFEDQDTGESREVDILAANLKEVLKEDEELFTWLSTEVLASCKNNTNPFVFFTRNVQDESRPTSLDIPINGIPFTWPSSIAEPGQNIRQQALSLLWEYDHRLTVQRMSSQFCAIVAKKGGAELVAEHGGLYNQLVVPLIKAIEYEKNLKRSSTIDIFSVELFYPLIVLSDELYVCHVSAERPTVTKARHVVLYRQYRSATIKGTFIMDVIARSFLEEYQSLIQTEAERIRKFLERNIEGIRGFVERMGKR